MLAPRQWTAQELDSDLRTAIDVFRRERLSRADLIVSLWDGRIMPIECKVSNSAVNSVKRLNREAAGKAESWIGDFGKKQVVPVAVLSGVYKLHNLLSAQERGLVLFWTHHLGALTEWVGATRPAG
ncbi:MAG TPA: XamI family restriction endonuclease [Thermoanaerobaculia bacterium]|jgi:hypothetical protein|nr:XamI family restriction endonuclease [Thermoanaerobaculia bacterium]